MIYTVFHFNKNANNEKEHIPDFKACLRRTFLVVYTCKIAVCATHFQNMFVLKDIILKRALMLKLCPKTEFLFRVFVPERLCLNLLLMTHLGLLNR